MSTFKLTPARFWSALALTAAAASLGVNAAIASPVPSAELSLGQGDNLPDVIVVGQEYNPSVKVSMTSDMVSQPAGTYVASVVITATDPTQGTPMQLPLCALPLESTVTQVISCPSPLTANVPIDFSVEVSIIDTATGSPLAQSFYPHSAR